MTSPRGLVIGTAGHIDHGKTSLVYALTGIDTDRLAEEKKRGISIDLGFAHLTLPNGRRIGFIDVPGHKRFIRNMLAGAGGIQAVLLVVAADESVKPQTREHFDICRLLGIEHGIIVLTKIDLATPERIRAATESVRALCADSFLGDAPLVSVSAVTGVGLAELKDELALLTDRISPCDDSGLARLPIDRSFALKGFGTVVTGTLWSGAMRTGDTLQIHPSGQTARVRGLQAHSEFIEAAAAGQRVAVNLTGIDSAEIRRGFTLHHAQGLEAASLLDVSIEWLHPSDPPRRGESFTFHIGTADIPATVKVLKKTGVQTLARVRLSEPFLALPGDRFVLRNLSPPQTAGGGYVIDAFPPARLNRVKTIARLESLAHADHAKRVEILIEERPNGSRLSDLVRSTGMRPGELTSIVLANPRLVFSETTQRIVTKAWIAASRRKLLDWLSAFHRKNPSAAGAPISLARMGWEPNLATLVFDRLPEIRVQGDLVSLATHKARLSDHESQALLHIEHAYRQAGLEPRPVNEVLKSLGADANQGRGLLESLVKNRKLVRVTEDLVFHSDAIAHIRESLSVQPGRRFSVPEFKDWMRISRKYAIPLLEYLDRQHVTRREGDSRIVL